MARPKSTTPTDAELAILGVLWERGPATVREVQQALNRHRRPQTGYTTALKLMQIMMDKGWLERDESNRSHVYRPRQSAEQTQQHLLGDLIDKAFAGSTSRMVLQALSAKPADDRELAEIRAMLDRMERGGREGSA